VAPGGSPDGGPVWRKWWTRGTGQGILVRDDGLVHRFQVQADSQPSRLFLCHHQVGNPGRCVHLLDDVTIENAL